jgi:D-3-phosphoglycerate dehydrogenase/(S)-sulfolactate dehydrogenase
VTHKRVLITPQFLVPGDPVDQWLREHGCETVHRAYQGPRTHEELVELFHDVDAAIIASDRISAAVMDAAPRLRVIARPGVGYDSVDVAAATERGIAVCNMPGINRTAVSELTIALLLLCARRIPTNIDDVRAGSWQRLEGRELRGATLGLVGLGAIGKAVAALARSFGMTILAHDRAEDPEYAARHGVRYVGTEELLGESDYVSLHMFLDSSTRHWIDEAKLAMMKPTAYLINTSRGVIVDEAALYRALTNGAIAGAALDVTEVEPLPTDSPLRRLSNVYITPHLGGVTREARQRSGWGAAHNVLNILDGHELTDVVNPEALAVRRNGDRATAGSG